jgi:ribosome-associated heat shock protein Hsp15
MVRTRSDASALAQAGFVRLNGKRVTAPSHLVRVGDVVTLALDRTVKVIQVEGFLERRGAAPTARALYRDLTTSSGAKTSQIKACIFAGIPPKVSPGNGR